MPDIRDFGAAGDGKADDTDAIQHAVDERGGHLVLPPGTYRIRRPIVVQLDRHGPFALSGSGGTARLVMEGEGPALHLVGTHGGTAAPGTVPDGVLRSERLPTVSALEIVGEHDQADGIRIEGTMQATLSGLLIRRCRYGVHLVRRNRNFLLADAHIYDGRGPAIGVYFDGVNLHQAIIVGSHISYCKHAGLKIRGSEIRNLQITGCDIEYNHDPDAPDSADVWIDARKGTVREGTICSNTIQARESPGGANVRIEGPEDPASKGAGLWTIAGNILQSQAVNLLLRNCRGVTVTGNSFASAFHRSLVIERCRHIVVASSIFDHNPDYPGDRIDGIEIRGSSGVNLTGLILESTRAGDEEEGAAVEVADSSEVAITGCQVLDPAHRGIDLHAVRNSRVADCTILDRRAEPTMREALRARDASRDLLIAGNLLGHGTRAALVTAQADPTIRDNVEIGQDAGQT